MIMLHGRIALCAAVCLIVRIASSDAFAQQTTLPPELQKNPYVVETEKFLDAWNAKILSFPKKSELKDAFFNELKTG